MRPLWLHSVRMLVMISLLAVMSKGVDRAVAQQDARSTPTTPKESTSNERNSNWNWYGNGVLVRPPSQDNTGGYAQPYYPPGRPTPQYRDSPPSVWEQPSNLRNDGSRVPAGQPVYKGPFDKAPVEKNRPWAEVPPLEPQGSEYGDRERRERPWPPQEGYRDYDRPPRGYPPSEGYYPYGNERNPPPSHYYETPNGYWENPPGRRGWDEYAPSYEWRDRGWDNWRPPAPYSNREYYPW
ncbi:MAG: hypothetical protein G8345_09260 [Magnetococcales bacterium]|nr:hypothetical protein [Magnetococcales bacterium]